MTKAKRHPAFRSRIVERENASTSRFLESPSTSRRDSSHRHPAASSGISYDPYLRAPRNPNSESRPIFFLSPAAPPTAGSIPHPASLVYDPYASQAGISEPEPPAASPTMFRKPETDNRKPSFPVPDPPLAEPGPPDSEESRRSIPSDRGGPLPDDPGLVSGTRLNRSPPPPLDAGFWQPRPVSCAAS